MERAIYGERVCTIVLAWQCFDDAPLVLAANRDELIERPSDRPLRLRESPALWGGRDRVAGGTWLAVDPLGRVCAVTNRHPGGRVPSRDASRNSRGAIPTDVLSAPDGDGGAMNVMTALRAYAFNPVNALYLSAETAYWVGLDDEAGFQSQHLTPGVHVLTEQNPDEAESPKTAGLRAAATDAAQSASDPLAFLEALRALVRSHDRFGDGPQTAACIHADTVPDGRFGTVSSATVLLTPDGVAFEHAEGYPCRTPYEPVLGDGRPVGEAAT